MYYFCNVSVTKAKEILLKIKIKGKLFYQVVVGEYKLEEEGLRLKKELIQRGIQSEVINL